MTVEQREDRNRQRMVERREKAEAKEAGRVCAGVDGEGHAGAYFLLAAASDRGFERWIASDGPEGLSTEECFSFLVGLPEDLTLWGFSFGYDVNMMLRDVPIHRLIRLHETGWLRWGRFRVHWIPGKLLQVSECRFDPVRGVQGKTLRTVRVWDQFPWQGSSFVAWLEGSGLAPPEEIAVIRRMKEQRPDFDKEDPAEVLAYCLAECRLLARGADRVHEMLRGTGLRLRTFHSPATVSKELMRTEGVAACQSGRAPEAHPAEVRGLFGGAYFGGRAETSVVGPVEGPLFMYDIRSAYPTIMTGLPCLAHGSWRHGGEAGPWSLTRAAWRRPGALWGPFPVRPRVGSLKWPTEGSGWFWQAEVDGVAHLGKVKVLDRWTWEPGCDHRPFAYLGDLYAERAALKRVGDPRQYVLKIALNASYGATAEHMRRGMRHEPRWAEKMWAGLITAGTRGMIGAQLGPDVVMTATDGILCRSELDVPIGERLGEWEVERYDEGFVVGPGVYFLRKGDRWVKFKSRGINARAFTVEDFQACWEAQGREGRLPIPQTRFIGLGTALHRVHGMEPPGERMWRQFLDYTPVRSLSLEPRRRWLTGDNWDGRSKAPTAGGVDRAATADLMTMLRLTAALRRETDPVKRTKLYALLAAISTDDGEERGFFREDDQPWN